MPWEAALGGGLSETGERHEARWEPDPVNVSSARRFVTQALHGWGLAALADDAALVTSELATNAVRHARTPFAVTVHRLPDGLLLLLRDGVPTLPSLRLPEGDPRPGGHGLHLLNALCLRWGAAPDGAGGKSVWAVLGGRRRDS